MDNSEGTDYGSGGWAGWSRGREENGATNSINNKIFFKKLKFDIVNIC